MKGLFVTFEGIEGSGKTTIAKRISEHLNGEGHNAILTREPGGTEIGREIRRLLLDPENSGIHPVTELLLYFADRSEHVRKVISPALKRGDIIICDRFSDSTIAYQGFGRGIDIDMLNDLDRIARDGVKPDLTFVLDLDVRTGLGRNVLINKSDRFEMEEIAFHERVRNGYLRIAEQEPDRIRVIDALQPLDSVWEEIRVIIESYLDNAG
ncbi:thymidylate kinase [bacterium BMS3Bbin06]|nr:thymidylate kinase [bacterium BMS3Abin08]GBE33709.1 thymidylate kinase [bacterium BMS3Bbin06]HDO35045.1 dTMP kinase [Nitrospirota bacterium]